MSVVLRRDPLQTLSYTLFELTGEKLYELFLFFTRNPYVSRAIRQRYGKKRVGRSGRSRENVVISPTPKSLRRSVSVPAIEEEDDYELPQDEPYLEPAVNTTAAAEKAKLETLEAELARLRAEMAHFMQVQASMAPMAHAHASSNGVNLSTSEYESSAPGEGAQLRTNNGAPVAGLSVNIPPPPPPPSINVKKGAFSDSLINGGASTSNPISFSQPQPSLKPATESRHSNSMSLSDMVKGSNRNTLRKVEGDRSPGGTVKREAKVAANGTDVGSVLQQALRHRFKSVSGSPDAKVPQPRSTDVSEYEE